MSLVDALQTAAIGFGSATLTGNARNVAELAKDLYKRSQLKPGESTFKGKPGKIDPLSAARGRKDPLLGIDWYCELPTLDGASAETRFLPWEMVEEATLPMQEFEIQSNYRAGKMYHYPSHQNLGNLTLKLYEDTTGKSTAYIKNWQSLIFNDESGLYNPPSRIKKQISFTLFDVAKYEVMVITYSGCWPQNMDALNLVGGSSERIIPGITFSVDNIRMSFAQLTSQQVDSALINSGKSFPDFSGVYER